MIRLVLLVAFVLNICSCDQAPPVEPSASPRIASFSPALTSIVQSLELGDCIVGRSAFCRDVDASVPVVGDLHEVDYETLVRIRPTHVLVQGTEQSVDPGLVALASDHGWVVEACKVDGVDDIRRTYSRLPRLMLSDDKDRLAGCLAIVNAHDAALDDVTSTRIEGLDGQRVLMISPFQSPLAWGPDTWLGQLLEMLGGVNAVQSRGWIAMGMEDLLRIEVDRILLISERPPGEDNPIVDLVHGRKGVMIDVLVHPDIHVPAASTPRIAAELRSILERGGGQ